MKKYLLTVGISISMLFSGNAFGQITINSSDFVSANDTVRLSTGLNVDFIDFTQTGEGFLWDFSALEPVKQTVDTFINYIYTPHWLVFFGKANLAKHLPYDIPVPGLPVTDIYEYYKNSSGSFSFAGFDASLNGIPLPFVYTNPDILYKFPLEYGNVDSSASGSSLSIDNLMYILVDRHRKNTVDGYGTLITPYGTFEVLRLKSEVSEFDSLYLDSLNSGFPIHRNYVEYKWLAKGGKEPMLQISTSNLGITSVYIDSVRSNLIGIDEKEIKPVTLFPNPCKDNFTVRFSSPPRREVNLKIFSQNGKLLLSERRYVEGKKMNVLLKNRDVKGNCIVVLNWDKFYITRKLIIIK